MLIYLHGFRSAPSSHKARLLAKRLTERGLADRFWCEQLPVSPAEAIRTVEQAINASPEPAVLVGSSLGGYYATWLAEKHDIKAALINPAAHAAEILAPWTGPHTNLYTGENFELTRQHIEELEDLWIPELTRPERFWLIVETGDEVIDYRDAVTRYAGARQTITEGGDHSLQSFPRMMDEIIDFALPE